jgi:hypothetical protein
MRVRVGITAVALATIVLSAAPADAMGAEANALAAQVAATRAALGLPQLVEAPDLTQIAERHAARVAAAGGDPFHNRHLPAEAGGYRIELGEVVGRVATTSGWDVSLHQGFLASPTHRRVITWPRYLEVGIGTAIGASGDLYAVEVFRGPPFPSRQRRESPPVARASRAATPPTSEAPVTAAPAKGPSPVAWAAPPSPRPAAVMRPAPPQPAWETVPWIALTVALLLVVGTPYPTGWSPRSATA